MGQMIENLGNLVSRKLRNINATIRLEDKSHYDYHKKVLFGILCAMDAMEMDYEFEFDENGEMYKSVTIMGRKFEVKE